VFRGCSAEDVVTAEGVRFWMRRDQPGWSLSGDVVGVTARIISVSTTLSLTGTGFDSRIRKGVSW
jgi:hypothetical protein